MEDRMQKARKFYEDFPLLRELALTSPIVKSCVNGYISGAWSRNEAIEQLILALNDVATTQTEQVFKLIRITGTNPNPNK